MWTLIRCFLCVTCIFTLQETWLCLCSGMTCYHSAMMLAGISFLLALFACWCVMLYSFTNYIFLSNTLGIFFARKKQSKTNDVALYLFG